MLIKTSFCSHSNLVNFRLYIFNSNSFNSINLNWFRNWNGFCLKIIYGQLLKLVTKSISLAVCLDAALVNFAIKLNLKSSIVHISPHTKKNSVTYLNSSRDISSTVGDTFLLACLGVSVVIEGPIILRIISINGTIPLRL